MAQIHVRRDEVFYQLALGEVENVGVISAKKLIKHFGTATEVFSQKKRELMQVQGMTQVRAAAISDFSGFDKIEKEFVFAEAENVEIISFQDGNFPKRLNHCVDGPIVLFKKGNADLNAKRMVSIVGTRKITDYGKQVTKELIESMLPYGITVISGLAYGVDIQAHKACLNMGLPTIGVMANGIDKVYPASHTRHAWEILEKGALLTEFFSGTAPDRENFPKRNRIVAGMSDATIVVESGVTGGSIITANLANSYNRDVFAIPGGIYSDRSEGCNRLIKINKAALLESARDLEYIMGWTKDAKMKTVQKKIFVDLNSEEEKLIACLRDKGKVQIDLLSLETELPMSAVMVNLLNLELNGLVRALPGKLYEAC